MTSPGYPSPEQNDQRQPVKPGEELAGKYRVERVVGAGAMGVVVEAWHIELEQQVAVRIRNEHVARVLDVGMLEGKNIPYNRGGAVPLIQLWAEFCTASAPGTHPVP